MLVPETMEIGSCTVGHRIVEGKVSEQSVLSLCQDWVLIGSSQAQLFCDSWSHGAQGFGDNKR